MVASNNPLILTLMDLTTPQTVVAQMSPLHLALVVVGATAALSIVSYLFLTQIVTNRNFKEALVEFRVALAVINQANKDQQKACAFHQARMEKDSNGFKTDIHEINERFNEHLYESRPKEKIKTTRTNLSNHRG